MAVCAAAGWLVCADVSELGSDERERDSKRYYKWERVLCAVEGGRRSKEDSSRAPKQSEKNSRKKLNAPTKAVSN